MIKFTSKVSQFSQNKNAKMLRNVKKGQRKQILGTLNSIIGSTKTASIITQSYFETKKGEIM